MLNKETLDEIRKRLRDRQDLETILAVMGINAHPEQVRKWLKRSNNAG